MELLENELQDKGATGLITKPFDLDTILELVKNKISWKISSLGYNFSLEEKILDRL